MMRLRSRMVVTILAGCLVSAAKPDCPETGRETRGECRSYASEME